MVTYTVEAILKVTGHINAIDGRPAQSSLWQLKNALIECLRQIKHPDHPTEGHAPYLRSVQEQALPLTDTEQRVKEKQEISLKDVEDNFFNLCTALKQLLDHVIDDAYHSGATAMGQRRFGNSTPKQIIDRLVALYGKPSIKEIESALVRLNEPMDRMQPVEVMLRGIEEVQLSLLSNPDEHRELTAPMMISYALIKLTNCGMYAKALD